MCSTTGDVEYTGGYHDKCGERSLGKQLNLYGNPSVLNIPRCTDDILPHSSWYRSAALMASPHCIEHPRCTHDIPQCTHDIPRCTDESPSVLNTPPFVLSDIPPVYSMITPSVLHNPRCTTQTLCRVILALTQSHMWQNKIETSDKFSAIQLQEGRVFEVALVMSSTQTTIAKPRTLK